ncbi:MAG: sulfurtransferase [Acidobacteria bacterium]|nr:sulfurtransferase [Acidobacteriota bacterium]
MQHSEGFLKLVDDAKTRVRELSVEETRERLQANPDAKLIDVREDNEWSKGRAAGAEHLGRGVIERDIEQAHPDKDGELILYCGGGYRSALAADNLQRMGYRNVFSMAGGWKAWKDSSAPVEGEG